MTERSLEMTPLNSIFDDRLVAKLESENLQLPADARTSVRDAFVACLRVQRRAIPARPRTTFHPLILGPEGPALRD